MLLKTHENMKTFLKSTVALPFAAFLLLGSLFFQSCSQSNDIQPISALPNTVTVIVTDKDQGSSNDGPTSPIIVKQSTRHLQVFTTDNTKKMLLDTNIAGSFTYSFKTLSPDVNITASLTSTSLFLYDLDIDVNGKMHSHHGGSCPVTVYTITDYINF